MILGIVSVALKAEFNARPREYYINIGTGIWGTFFTWFAGGFGICAARNVKKQALLIACMTFVSFKAQKERPVTE